MAWIGPGTAGGQFLEWNATVWQPSFAPIGNVNISVQSLLGRVRARWISIQDGTLGGTIPNNYWAFPSSVTAQVPTWASNWLSIEKIVSVSPGGAAQTMRYVGSGGRGYALSSTATWAAGFLWYYRGGIHTLLANTRTFYGLKSTIVTPGNVEPSTFVDCVGFGNDSTDTNLQVMQNDSAGTCTKTDLGASFPAMTSSADFYELILFAAPGQTTSIQYQATQIFTGAQASGTLSSNLPTSNTELFPWIWLGNAGAGTFRHGLNAMYVQSNY